MSSAKFFRFKINQTQAKCFSNKMIRSRSQFIDEKEDKERGVKREEIYINSLLEISRLPALLLLLILS